MRGVFRTWIITLSIFLLLGADPCLARRRRNTHTVVRGETLYSIARAHGVNLNAIIRANRIKNPNVIDVGQVLVVPGGRRARKAARQETSIRMPKDAPRLIWPLKGRITSRYGPRRGRLHSGLDIAASNGIIITSAARGKVIRIGSGWRSYGKMVLIDHGRGYYTLYAHCSRIFVRKGQRVRKRQAIATVGATGNATGPHLHFEVWKDGKALNPEWFLEPLRTQTRIARR